MTILSQHRQLIKWFFSLIIILLFSFGQAEQLTNEQQKFDYRDRGKRAFDDRIYDMALNFFKNYRDCSKEDLDCYTEATSLIAETALRLGRNDLASEAITTFEKETNNFNKEGIYFDTYICTKCAVWIALGKLNEAKTLLSNRLQHFNEKEDLDRAKLLLANINLQLKSYDEALALFEELRNDPTSSLKNKSNLGILKIYLLRNKLNEANDLLEQLKQSSLAPQLISLYNILILLSDKQLDKALEVYRAIEKGRPLQGDYDWWLVSTQLAKALVKANRLEEALSIFEQSVLFSLTENDKAITQLNQADIYVRLSQLDPAIAILKRFREKYSKLPEFYLTDFRIGDLLRAQKKYAEAIVYYKYIFNNKNADREKRYQAQMNVGLCWQSLQNFTRATQEFQTAFQIAANDQEKTEALQLIAEALFQAKQYQKSADIYGQITKNYPTLPIAEDALRNQAKVFFEGKMYNYAIIIYQSYLRLYPQGRHVEAIELEYGISLRKLEKFDLALKVFKSFLTDHPQSINRPKILEEAYKTALLKNDTKEAEIFITEITQKFTDTSYYPDALYWQTYIAIIRNTPQAEVLALQFLKDIYGKKNSPIEKIIDVRFWLADLYNNRGDFTKARQTLLTIGKDQPDQPEAAQALYDAAHCSLLLKDYQEGLDSLKELEKHPLYTGDFKYQCLFLKSDFLTALQQYTSAIETLNEALKIVEPRSRLWWVAKGRIAELHVILGNMANMETSGDDVNQYFRNALIHINDCLIDAKEMPLDIRDLLLLNKAIVLEKLELFDDAFATYYTIVLNYSEDVVRKDPLRRDWKILEKAAFQAAEIAIKRRNFETAERIYSRIIRMSLPLRDEAKVRLNKLRQNLQKSSAIKNELEKEIDHA